MESGWKNVGQKGREQKARTIGQKGRRKIEEAAADNRNHLIVLVS